jgi:hypothetical protein
MLAAGVFVGPAGSGGTSARAVGATSAMIANTAMDPRAAVMIFLMTSSDS